MSIINPSEKIAFTPKEAAAGQRERLTVRLPDELDELICQESRKRGTSMNQTMIFILNKYFQ